MLNKSLDACTWTESGAGRGHAGQRWRLMQCKDPCTSCETQARGSSTILRWLIQITYHRYDCLLHQPSAAVLCNTIKPVRRQHSSHSVDGVLSVSRLNIIAHSGKKDRVAGQNCQCQEVTGCSQIPESGGACHRGEFHGQLLEAEHQPRPRTGL